MPKKKLTAAELTDDQVISRVFGRAVLKPIKEHVKELDNPSPPPKPPKVPTGNTVTGNEPCVK